MTTRIAPTRLYISMNFEKFSLASPGIPRKSYRILKKSKLFNLGVLNLSVLHESRWFLHTRLALEDIYTMVEDGPSPFPPEVVAALQPEALSSHCLNSLKNKRLRGRSQC